MKLEDYKYIVESDLDLISPPISKEELKFQKKCPLNKIYSSNSHFKREEVLKLYLRLPHLSTQMNQKSCNMIEGLDGWVFFGSTTANFEMQSGIMVFHDGSIFEGSFAQNSISIGRLITENLSVIIGHWENSNISNAVILNLNDKKLYEGEVVNKLPHGEGIEYSSGCVYTGHFKAGAKEGKGKLEWTNGNYYIGFFSNNKLHGYGEYFWKNGTTYKGFWKYSNFHGKGTYEWKHGETYDGNYKRGLKDGYGVYKHTNGHEYKGYWSKGRRDGSGTEYFNNEVVNNGIWAKGTLIKHVDSKGVTSATKALTPLLLKAISHKSESSSNVLTSLMFLNCPDGKLPEHNRRQSTGTVSYEKSSVSLLQMGKKEFLLDLSELHSLEKYKYSLKAHEKYPSFDFTNKFDENKYFTEFLQLSEEKWFKGEVNHNSVPDGNGVIIDKGNIYIGRWENGHMEGFGRLLSIKGNYFQGFWFNGQKQGFGIEIRQSATYIGDWVNGMRHGLGYLYSDNGWYYGSWTDGKQHGFGRLNYPDGSAYAGHFENGNIHGEGKLTLSNRKVIKGYWNCGNLV